MNYPSIHIEGAILSPGILERLEDAARQQSADFSVDPNAKVKDEIERRGAAARRAHRPTRPPGEAGRSRTKRTMAQVAVIRCGRIRMCQANAATPVELITLLKGPNATN